MNDLNLMPAAASSSVDGHDGSAHSAEASVARQGRTAEEGIEAGLAGGTPEDEKSLVSPEEVCPHESCRLPKPRCPKRELRLSAKELSPKRQN